MRRRLQAAVALATLLCGATRLHAQIQGQWTATGSLQIPRTGAANARASAGRVLAAGGSDGTGAALASAEIYQPVQGRWRLTGSMQVARTLFPAVTLSNGKILVEGGLGAGGIVLTGAELFDPNTGAWSPAGSLAVARFGHTATLLADGTVLVAGGCTAANCTASTATAELYLPATNSWSATGSLAAARGYHNALRLRTGTVLAIGGYGGAALATTELYSPATHAWTSAGSTATPRYLAAATLLPDGRVLASGGASGKYPLSSTEIYDPARNGWSPAGDMISARYGHSATNLADGTVVLAGGYSQPFSCGKACVGFVPTANAEIFTPGTGTFAATAPLGAALAFQTAIALTSGRAMVDAGVLADIYTPLSLSFSAVALNFGYLQLGLSSATQSVTLTNVSARATTFAAIKASGDFNQTNTCPATLAPGQACAITIGFTPGRTGARTGAVTLSDNDLGSPVQTIALSGTGESLALVLSPAAVDFGGVAVTLSAVQAVTLLNDGAAPVAIAAIAIAPAGRTFSQTNTCPASLGVQQSCTVQVTFTPPDVSTYKATLSVANGAGASPTLTLAGTGLDSP